MSAFSCFSNQPTYRAGRYLGRGGARCSEFGFFFNFSNIKKTFLELQPPSTPKPHPGLVAGSGPATMSAVFVYVFVHVWDRP